MAELLLPLLAWIVIGLLMIVVGYHYLLLAVLVLGRKSPLPPARRRLRFTILIPAHEEERLLAGALASVLDLDYPAELFRVVVIADNCTDHTPNIARQAGVACWERSDQSRRGKGYALEWAFRRLPVDDDHALVVLDADSRASRNMLTVFDAYLEAGHEAVQAANLLERTEDNLFTTFMALGNLVTNYFIYLPKFRLGSSAFLLGTGMCFRQRLLDHYYQKTYSISEDIDFSLRLIHRGIHVAFAPEAEVETIQPHEIRGASTQRVRWSSGTYALLWRNVRRCLLRGLRERSLLQLDTALTLISWSKSLIGVLFAVALPLGWIAGRSHGLIVLALLASYLLYLLLGIFLLRRRRHQIRHLLLAPLLVPWLLIISLFGLAGFRKSEWRRTSRK